MVIFYWYIWCTQVYIEVKCLILINVMGIGDREHYNNRGNLYRVIGKYGPICLGWYPEQPYLVP